MKSHNFTIVASGLDTEGDAFVDALYEAGCDDATVSIQKGLIILDFDRAARTFITALATAIDDVRKTGAKIERIEPDYLVNASEIGKRAGLGRAAIALYASGARGREFPRPVARVTTESPLWDWVEVSSWLYRSRKIPRQDAVQARMVRELNLILDPHQRPDASFAKLLTRLRPQWTSSIG